MNNKSQIMMSLRKSPQKLRDYVVARKGGIRHSE